MLVWMLMTLWSVIILISLRFMEKERVRWRWRNFGLDYNVKAWEQ